MRTEQLEWNVMIEKIRSDDTSLGSKLNCFGFLHEHGMTLCSCPRLSLIDRRFAGYCVTDDRFVPFVDALKVNTTLIEIVMSGTLKSFHP